MRNAIGLGIVVGLVVVSTACGKKSDTGAAAGAESAAVPVATAPPPAPSASAAPDPADAAPADPAASADAAVPPPSPAMAAAHPAYLHALTDLRIARFNLIRKGGDMAMKWDENAAIRVIDRAIREINMAAISDGKNLNDHQPSDMTVDYRGRLHKALEALRAARGDVAKPEDNAAVARLRARAIANIDEATALTEQGIADLERAGGTTMVRPPPPGVRPAPPRPH